MRDRRRRNIRFLGEVELAGFGVSRETWKTVHRFQ